MSGGLDATERAEDYLRRFDRVVVVAPHPDDDVLGCGGVLAAAAALGLEAAVVYVTDGGASHPGSAAYPPERLRDVREVEARAALAVLGVTSEPRFLWIADGGVARLDGGAAGTIVAAIGRAIQGAARCRVVNAGRPDVENTGRRDVMGPEHPADAGGGARVLVLGPWARDHHTDHVAVSALVRHACAGRPDVTLLEYAVWLDELGTDRDRPEPGERTAIVLDIAPHAARKSAALAAHRSQLGSLITDSPSGFVLPPGLIAAAARPVEHFLLVRAEAPG